MCNDYRLEVEIASVMDDFDDLKIKIKLPEGTPNVAAREDIRITDMAPIVRSVGTREAGELVNRRWSWPSKKGAPVYNLRKEGFAGKAPDLDTGRCLILADGFYEFTDPQEPREDKRLDKWLFTMKDHRWFCIAGIWKADPTVGEAFAMLTIDAGEPAALAIYLVPSRPAAAAGSFMIAGSPVVLEKAMGWPPLIRRQVLSCGKASRSGPDWDRPTRWAIGPERAI